MDTGICVTENRVCGGGIRGEGSVSVRSQEALLFFFFKTSRGVEAGRGLQESERGVHSPDVSREWA